MDKACESKSSLGVVKIHNINNDNSKDTLLAEPCCWYEAY
jgi:hypothetical protein